MNINISGLLLVVIIMGVLLALVELIAYGVKVLVLGLLAKAGAAWQDYKIKREQRILSRTNQRRAGK